LDVGTLPRLTLIPSNIVSQSSFYSIWVLVTLAFVVFSCLGVTPTKRLEYLCLFLVIEVLCLSFLAAASPVSKTPKRLQTWGPIITAVSATAPIFAFEPLAPGSITTAGDIECGDYRLEDVRNPKNCR